MRLTQVFSDSTVRNRSVYSGEITPMPGCPDVAVSHAVYCDGPGGHGKNANRRRLNQLRALGYSAVVCTVCADNHKQRAILKSVGWTLLYEFNNKRTKNCVLVYMKEL